jgi:hypothetical protein
MANLTLRSVKGSPLTNAEMDGNFEYFTGSHTLTGSLTTTEGIITSGSILISGSIIPNVPSGSLTSSFSLGSPTAAWKDIYVSEGSIKFIASGSQTVISATPTGISINGGSTLTGNGFSGSISNTGSIINSGSVNTIGNSIITGSSSTSGSVTIIGTTTATGSLNTSGSVITIGNVTTTGSFRVTGSSAFNGNLVVSGSLIVSGSNTIINIGSLTTGDANNVAKNDSMAQGEGSLASGSFTHAEGSYSTALGYASHAEGNSSTGLYAWNTNSTVNGLIQLPTSVGNITSSFISGESLLVDSTGTIIKYTISNSFFAASRTQIQLTDTVIDYGAGVPISLYSQLSSPGTQLTNQTLFLGGNTAHSEGYVTTALGSYSHAEGENTQTIGYASHTEGVGTIASGDYQHVQGKYNITSSAEAAFIVGNGTSDSNRSNLIFASGSIVTINDILQLQRRTTNPGSPIEGMIMASGSAGSSKLFYYNGSAWIDLTA